ncbi:MAG TPA: ABC transporter transmembrane domain-containing protein, partial [bacterium]|nr:ABC transporter transmembrane domain-containing protein [bacterium]
MKSFRKNVFRLNRYIRIPWRMMTATVILMIVNSALAGISITAIGPILDVVFNHGTLHLPASLPAGLRPGLEQLAGVVNRMPPLLLLSRILAILTAAFLVKAVIGYFQQYLNGKFALKIVAQLRREVFGRYLNSPLELNQRKRLGERLSHFTYDIYLLQTAFGTNLPKLVFNFILTAAYFFVILFIHWRLTLLSLLILPAFAWPTLRFGQRIRKLSRDSQESLANLNSLIQESLTNLPVVKSFNAQPRVEERFEAENFRFYRVSLKS